MLTEAMISRLRHAWIHGTEVPLGSEWLHAGASAREAGVSVRTLNKWGDDGEIERRDTDSGWRYPRNAVRERARTYWRTVRFKRAAMPAWLVAELEEQRAA